jgi:hypothetical protein
VGALKAAHSASTWEKVACGAFSAECPRCRRQKARLLPAASGCFMGGKSDSLLASGGNVTCERPCRAAMLPSRTLRAAPARAYTTD